MIKKKVCMLGAFAVGKTSLVKRYVESIFDERYQSTLGVKIDKKKVEIKGKEVHLLLWDIFGEDEFLKVRASYLRGASGCMIVVDITRHSTLGTALDLKRKAEEVCGDIPFIFVLNKTDIADSWEIDKHAVKKLFDKGGQIVKTSAKTGENVENAFLSLTEMMLKEKK